MPQRPTAELRPVPSFCRFVFVGGETSFVVTKTLVQTTSRLFATKETEDLPNEKPEHFRAYLKWLEGNGIKTNEDLERRSLIWLELGELWFFGQRIGALQFQDAVMLKCMDKRADGFCGINKWTVSRFFEPPYDIKSPFHTFLVDTYFMETIADILDYYDNELFSMACCARQVYLSEVIAKMMIKKRKRERQQREEKKKRTWKLLPEEEPQEEPIKFNVLFDYLVSTPSPNNNDNKIPASRRGADSSDEDERGSTRMRGSVKLDLIKRVLKYGTVD